MTQQRASAIKKLAAKLEEEEKAHRRKVGMNLNASEFMPATFVSSGHLKKTAKTKTKNKSTDEDTRLDDCPICLIPDNERSPYWIDQRACLKCGHAYHSECIHDWIKTKTASGSKVTCPMCREELHLDDRVQVQQTLTLVNIQRNKASQERSALKHEKERLHMFTL